MSIVIAYTVASVILFVCGCLFGRIIMSGKFESSGYATTWGKPFDMLLVAFEFFGVPLILIGSLYLADSTGSILRVAVLVSVYSLGLASGISRG